MLRAILPIITPTFSDIREDKGKSRLVVDAVWKELTPPESRLVTLIAQRDFDVDYILDTAAGEISYGSSDESRKLQAHNRILATIATVCRPRFDEVDGKPVLRHDVLLDYVMSELRPDAHRMKERG